ncbi:metallophosphoesterase family protein [Thermovibrio sp.]
MRIAHVSDTHLGYMQYNLYERKKDFFKSFKKVVDKCLDMEVDLLIHSGDLFESFNPDVESLSFVVEELKRLKDKGIEVVAITGNHDKALRKDKKPPQVLLKRLELLKLLEPYGELWVKELYIAGFGYMPGRYIETFREKAFPRWEERAKTTGASVFVFHQAVDQFLPYGGAYELLITQLPKNFNYYAAGHLHTYRVEKVNGGIFSYPGSTEFRTFDEAENGKRGFNVIEIEKREFERVEIEGLRPFLILRTEEERAGEELKELLERSKSQDQKPVVVIAYSYKSTPIERFKSLLEEIRNSSLYLRVVVSEKSSKEELIPEKGKSLREVFEEFCRANSLPQEVISLGKEIIENHPENTRELLKEFLKERLKENFSAVEKFISL